MGGRTAPQEDATMRSRRSLARRGGTACQRSMRRRKRITRPPPRVGDTGVEPVTSCVSCKRANQLRQSPRQSLTGPRHASTGMVGAGADAGGRGGDRIRTGVHGFAGRCLTTRPLRRRLRRVVGDDAADAIHRGAPRRPYTCSPRQFAAWLHCPASPLPHSWVRRRIPAGHDLRRDPRDHIQRLGRACALVRRSG